MAALEGKTAIVTGASSGIGAATAAALAREGARVAGGARRVDELQTEIKLELDVTDRESCERAIPFGSRPKKMRTRCWKPTSTDCSG